MKVIKAVDRDEVDNSHRDIFEGGQVVMNPLVDNDDSESYRFNVVNFKGGARTKFHTHTCDQVLYVTNGKGFVGTCDEEIAITEGDTASDPGGRGASPRREPWRRLFAYLPADGAVYD